MPADTHSQYLRRLFLNNSLSEAAIGRWQARSHTPICRVPIFWRGNAHRSWQRNRCRCTTTAAGNPQYFDSGGYNAGIVSRRSSATPLSVAPHSGCRRSGRCRPASGSRPSRIRLWWQPGMGRVLKSRSRHADSPAAHGQLPDSRRCMFAQRAGTCSGIEFTFKTVCGPR